LTTQAELAQAIAHHQAGRLPEAERIYERILRAEPRHADALHLLGVAAHQSGDHGRAVELISSAIESRPASPFYLNNLGEAHRALGEHETAADCYERALALAPDYSAAHYNLGLVHAVRERYGEAERCLRRAIELEPRDARAWASLGRVLARRLRTQEALEALRGAVAIDETLGAAWGDMAAALAMQDEHEEAVACAQRALSLDPDDADAYVSLAQAELSAWRFEAAETAAREALARNPKHDEARGWLGHALLHQGRVDEASDAFLAPVRELRAVGADVNTRHRAFREVSLVKLQHDIEQLEHLEAVGRLPGGLAWLPEAYRAFRDRLPEDVGRTVMLTVPEDDPVAPYYNRLILDAPEPAIPGGALNPNLDYAAIEAAFLDDPLGYVHFDDLLNDAALVGLQRFCTDPTIWFEMKFHNEVGSSLLNGFCCPLLLQIAFELRAAFPRVFGEHLFRTCWTYKYFQNGADGHIHADTGAASVNLWVTPDASNLDPDTGGLVLWNKRVPDEYFRRDGREQMNIALAQIAEPDADAGYVPYGCNRAMMFRSNVLHKSHTLAFREGYEDRRVSITFLYGWPWQ